MAGIVAFSSTLPSASGTISRPNGVDSPSCVIVPDQAPARSAGVGAGTACASALAGTDDSARRDAQAMAFMASTATLTARSRS